MSFEILSTAAQLYKQEQDWQCSLLKYKRNVETHVETHVRHPTYTAAELLAENLDINL